MTEPEVRKPRGILHQRIGEEKFHLSLHPATSPLDFFVEHYWIVTWDLTGQEPYRSEVLPHPSVHLVIEDDRAYVIGVMRGKFARFLAGKGRAFGVKFRSGAFYPFVQSPVSRLTDRSISLRDTFGAGSEELADAMRACGDEEEMVERAEAFLRGRLPERDENMPFIRGIIDRIMADRSITKVDDLVSQLDRNKRALQRLFSRYVGVSPKWVIQRYRLHEAAERLAAGDAVDWPKLALDLGYFDQAHFINDFKRIVGKSPAEYARSNS